MSLDLELAARAIAENVASAFERGCEHTFGDGERERAVQGLMRELLLVLPATSGDVLAYACNRRILLKNSEAGRSSAAKDAYWRKSYYWRRQNALPVLDWRGARDQSSPEHHLGRRLRRCHRVFQRNRHLSVLADCGMHGSRVESVSLVDGAVTMRDQ